MVQESPLELLEFRSGDDPELLVQQHSCLLVHRQRLRLPPGPVEGKHQLSARPLPQRARCDLRLEARDQVVRASGREPGVDEIRARGVAQVAEPANLVLRERLVAEVGQGLAAPERQRRLEESLRFCRLSVVEDGSSLPRQLLEAVAVELVRLEAKAVAGRRRLDPVGSERLAEM